ncbi:MAG TPA: poly-gamma-glutamate hydrolase family protein [Blastocatellia bacterium]|nr:poly-gamma-glutamate hydrolase family protein [Blastocatellia bacterium]
MPSYNARIIPSSNIPNAPIREHCLAHRSQITTIGRNKGQQVRVGRYAPDGVTLADFALYTVIELHDEEPDVVFLGFRDPESEKHDLRDRLGLSGTDTFRGKIDSQVPHPTYTDAEAEANSEFVERLTDNGRHRGLIVIAPHGGNIERHTDEQAERVRKLLAPKCVSAWVCKGFKQGGGAFDRWHITSTDISEESFPKLKTVIGRRFEYAVAFHGWDEDSICIGGSASPALKLEIKAAVERVVSGSGIVVSTNEEGRCPEGFNGDDPKNIVNRLGASGIQLEQSSEARARFGIQIADAVAGVLGPEIKVCVAPVFTASSAWACLFKSVGASALAILLGRAPSVTCEIKRLLFRIRHCRAGNTDPCVEL